METRHEITARVRKLRPIFFQIGLLTALGVTFGAFKWTTEGDRVVLKDKVWENHIDSALGEIKIIDENKPKTEQQEELKLTVKLDLNQVKIVENERPADTTIYEDIDEYNPLLAAGPPNPFGIEQDIEQFENNDPVDYTEVMPSYKGGDAEMKRFIKKHMLVPHILMETAKGQDVRIYVQAVVEKDGSLTQIKVSKDGGYPDAGNAALAVVKKMPKWNPGYQSIWPVRVLIQIPITIRIQ